MIVVDSAVISIAILIRKPAFSVMSWTEEHEQVLDVCNQHDLLLEMLQQVLLRTYIIFCDLFIIIVVVIIIVILLVSFMKHDCFFNAKHKWKKHAWI